MLCFLCGCPEQITYLLFLSSNQILPFLYWLGEVYTVHGDLDLADDVVFTETIKVKHLQHQSLTAQLAVGYLKRAEKEKANATVLCTLRSSCWIL